MYEILVIKKHGTKEVQNIAIEMKFVNHMVDVSFMPFVHAFSGNLMTK